MGKIIAVAIPKGGVGKTTTSVNLAISFALSDKRTLLIDVDPAGSCASSLGFKSEDIKEDIISVLNFTGSFQHVIQKTELINLDFIPIRHLPYMDEIKLSKLTSNENLLSNILRPEAFSYDFVIIDCPPYLVGTTNSALIAADSVLIPMAPGQFSLNAVDKIFERLKAIRKIYNHNLKIEGILLTIYEFNTRVSFATKKELFKKFPNLILNTSIPKNATVGEASIHKKPVVLYDPSASAARAYINLANEIIQRKDMFDYNSQIW
jgi:chromosome partitioning protein